MQVARERMPVSYRVASAEEPHPLAARVVGVHERGEHGRVFRGQVIADQAGVIVGLTPATVARGRGARPHADELELLGESPSRPP
jgi:hypothetical protein